MKTVRDSYAAALAHWTLSGGVSQDWLPALTPHLDDGERAEILQRAERYSVAVAIPALVLDGAYHTINVSPHMWLKHGDPSSVGPGIGFSLPTRIDDESIDAVIASGTEIGKALQFARDNWGDQLVEDDWVDMVCLSLRSPQGREFRSLDVMYAMNRLWNDFNHNCGDEPHSVVLNESIVQITHLRAVECELRGSERGGFHFMACIDCGSGMTSSFCPHCNHNPGSPFAKCSHDVPVPAKVIAYVRDHLGHEFVVDPAQAHALEAKENRDIRDYHARCALYRTVYAPRRLTRSEVAKRAFNRAAVWLFKIRIRESWGV